MNNVLSVVYNENNSEAIIVIALAVAILVALIVVICLLVRRGGKKEIEKTNEKMNKLDEKIEQSLAKKGEITIQASDFTEEDLEKLRRYKKMFDEKLITEEEYCIMKKQILKVQIKK